MSTNNMAASWRQANDVIAPGWFTSQIIKYIISVYIKKLRCDRFRNFIRQLCSGRKFFLSFS